METIGGGGGGGGGGEGTGGKQQLISPCEHVLLLVMVSSPRLTLCDNLLLELVQADYKQAATLMKRSRDLTMPGTSAKLGLVKSHPQSYLAQFSSIQSQTIFAWLACRPVGDGAPSGRQGDGCISSSSSSSRVSIKIPFDAFDKSEWAIRSNVFGKP